MSTIAALCFLTWILEGKGEVYNRCNQGLATIPNDIPSSAIEIHLCENDLVSLPDHAFSQFSSLEVLFLDHNQISYVGSIHNLLLLRVVNLSYNRLQLLQADLFSNVTTVYRHSNYIGRTVGLDLDLSHNQICAIHRDTFGNVPMFVGDLNLSYNSLSCLPDFVFSNFILVGKIFVEHNELSWITGEAFQMHVSAYTYTDSMSVSLAHNKLTSVPAHLTSFMPSHNHLHSLNLSNNKILSIHPEAKLHAFSRLKLDHNRLSCLPDGIIGYNTWDVDLSFNDIPTVQSGVFLGEIPHDVNRIGNPVHCSTMCWAKHASGGDGFHINRCVDGTDWSTWDGLDSNGQCVIPPAPVCPFSFPIPSPCPSQCPVYLHNYCNTGITDIPFVIPTYVREIPALAFTSFSDLRRLLLNNNQIYFVHSNALQNLVFLKELNLSYNKIKFLPEGLFSNVASGLGFMEGLKLLLNNNEIEIVHPGAFGKAHLPLEALILTNNRISCLPDGVFANCYLYGSLNLNNNQLTYITEETLRIGGDASVLLHVSLDRNHLTYLPANLTLNMPFLESFGFYQNEISAIHPDVRLFANIVSLSENRLTCLPDGMVYNNTSLHITLDHNQLPTISKDLSQDLSYPNLDL